MCTSECVWFNDSNFINDLRATLPRKCKLRHLIRQICLPLPTRTARKGRRNIQAWIPLKEISRPQQQRHRLRRHDRIVLRRWEMDDAKGMPEHDICICDGFGRIRSDPCGEAVRWFTGSLRDMATGGVNLVVRVYFPKFSQ